MKELNPSWHPHDRYNSLLTNRINDWFYDDLRLALTGQENGVPFFPNVNLIDVFGVDLV